ncbi:MAG: GspE/PulE family protein [Phascolarctobacterium sp.]|nr:GspE/PulE family protein [Phascolarctobacterium sp.]
MEIGIYDKVAENDSNIVNLVEAIFSCSLQLNASDIHVEPGVEVTRVRIRIDGLLKELCRLPMIKHNSILSRIKLLSELDISERRLPQDGHLTVEFQGRSIDMRISTLPTINGEKMVIRLLDKNINLRSLDKLDLTRDNYNKYEKLIRSPNGLILVTGPTGSGKTTTLYATLREINSESKNIVTIEDPVEYYLEGINQVAINKKIGLNFDIGLRALVRQDPNVIMLGEIRDRQSAETAVQAALTGHLVFSTLHTNNALGAINRLTNIGVETFLLLSSLRGVLAQRLLRRVCPHCKRKYVASALERAYLGKKEGVIELTKGVGCANCFGTGYKGRLAVHEFLFMDDELVSMLLHKKEEASIVAYMRSHGMRSLKDDAVDKVLLGQTTVEELLRNALL